MAELFYVIGTVIAKENGKEVRVTDIRAIPVMAGVNLEDICDHLFVEWSRLPKGGGPYPLSKDWGK